MSKKLHLSLAHAGQQPIAVKRGRIRSDSIRCHGTASDGVEVDHPMKVQAFLHLSNGRGMATLYKGRQGKRHGACVGSYSLEELRALDVAIPFAIAVLTGLMEDAGLEPR